jgi:hypothetical protein
LVKLAIDSYWAGKEIDELIEEHLEPEDGLPLAHKYFGNGGQGRNACPMSISVNISLANSDFKNFDSKLDELKCEAA